MITPLARHPIAPSPSPMPSNAVLAHIVHYEGTQAGHVVFGVAAVVAILAVLMFLAGRVRSARSGSRSASSHWR